MRNIGIGNRIKYLRGDESLPSFAKKLGIHKNTLARYEKEENLPDVGFLLDLCEVVGDEDVTPDWLINGEGPSPMPPYSEAHEEHRERIRPLITKLKDVVKNGRLSISWYDLRDYINGQYLPSDSELEEICDNISFYPFDAISSQRAPKEIKEENNKHICPTCDDGWPSDAGHLLGPEPTDSFANLNVAAFVLTEIEKAISDTGVGLLLKQKSDLLILSYNLINKFPPEEFLILERVLRSWQQAKDQQITTTEVNK